MREDDAQGVVFWSLIGAIVGARLFYVIGHFSEFDSFVDMLKIWEGGISLLGGIAGAVIVNVPRVRRAGYRFFQVADPVAPSLALGIMVGRIGDLIIADHLGKPTSWFLAWTYRGGTIAPPFACQDERCQASLQGGHLETITREGARLLDETGRVIAEGVGVHQAALYDMLSAAALFACAVLRDDAQAAPRRHPHPHVRAVVRRVADRRGLAAHRQALLRIHRQPVDRARRRDDQRRAADLVRVAPRSRGARRAAAPRRPMPASSNRSTERTDAAAEVGP